MPKNHQGTGSAVIVGGLPNDKSDPLSITGKGPASDNKVLPKTGRYFATKTKNCPY